MDRLYLWYLYLLILILNVLIGLVKLKFFDNATKILLLLLFIATVNESFCRLLMAFNLYYQPCYHIYSVLELTLTTVYFLYTIGIKSAYKYTRTIFFVCFCIGITNLYFQPLTIINTNVLVIECLVIIPMAHFAFYKMLLNDSIINIFQHPHFWFWSAFLLLWTSTFFFWAFLDHLMITKYKVIVSYCQILMNLATYLITGLTLLYYPKQIHDE